MSTVRLGNQYVLNSEALKRFCTPPRRVIVDILDDLLQEIERKAETGEEIIWDSLHLTVEPERQIAPGLRFRADVEMHRDDYVAGLKALALAEHERGKA